ncbi:extracellular solute-binding protein [Lachnotalea glycerini]|uniref:ABC transporter substrate-binding protein n=1 Tax=Lachnotalea glycerini TaxID=1763509 RepID=A0A371JE24_9FIRM|nr:extracellular solute-binding protein [Lachnotalea glycerini]RDY31019.1 ABC transporter substrate-binding protein [Lachnotalea glycerini]
MKKMFKKAAALFLACFMVTVSLDGCNKSETTDATSTDITKDQAAETDNQTTDQSSTGGYADYSTGFKENVKIQIPVYDRAFEGFNVTDNYYTQWIQKEFGDKYNVTVEFVSIGRTTEVTDYTQMLAAGTAPDIIFHYDMPQALAYYGEGAMQELDLGEIANYAPTYFESMGESISKYGSVEDKPTFFFAKRTDAYNWLTLIRQDWLDKVNMEMPHNLEEYNAVLKAWKDAGLGNGGGKLEQNNFTYDYAFREWPIDEKQRALYSDLSVAALPWQPTYDFLKNLNYEYNNGLIDPEFYLNTDDAATKADFVAGSSGVYALYLASSTDVIGSLLANDSDAKLAVLDPAAMVPEGKQPQSRAYWPFGMIMGINSTTSDEERVAIWMYLEWMSQPENLFFLQNGVEGETYTLDADGLAVKNTDYTGESQLSQNNNKDYWCLVTESAQYDKDELNYKANLANWAPSGYEYLIEDSYEYFNNYKQYMTADALYSVVVESVAEYKTTLNDLWKELYVKCVIASEADFDAVYKQAVEDYNAAGYQDILDEKTQAIEAGKYN